MAQTTPVPPYPGLRDWEALISFRPPAEVQAAVNKRFKGGARACHAIEDAHGAVNLDYYPVRVAALPVANGRTLQPGEVLEHVRRNLSLFVDNTPDGCTFAPYDLAIDRDTWLPPSVPTGVAGAVLTIDLVNKGVNVEDASVVLAEIAPGHWIFSTLWTPNDLNHPVSGNRQFGFTQAGSEVVFFIRAADRTTTLLDAATSEMVFTAGDKVWRSWQRKLAEFVNANGGAATVEQSISNRYDWDEVRARYFHPSIDWIA